MHCYMKKEDNSLLDVKKMLTNTIEQFIVYVHRNEAQFTYMYVCHYYHTNVSEADNIYKNPPTNVISPIFFSYFYFALGLHP